MSEETIINVSQSNDKNFSQPTTDYPYKITFRFAFTLVVCIFGIISNGLICHKIIKKKYLHISIYIFICNMAISDMVSLIASALTTPLTYFMSVSEHYQVSFDVGCRLTIYFITVGFVVSTLTLTVMAAERYLTIVHLATRKSITKNKNSKFKITIIITSIWIYSMVLSSPILHLVYVPKHLPYHCDTHNFGWRYNAVYYSIALSLNYFIPILAMMIMYIKITLHLRCKTADSSLLCIIDPKSRKVIKMLHIVTILYIITTFPYFITMLAIAFSDLTMVQFLSSTTPTISRLCSAAFILAIIASIENPILCMIYNKRLRITLPKWCRRQKRRVRNSSYQTS